MRVLIIEDDHKVAAFIRKGLEQEGYAVDVAYDGAEGATLLEESDYDIAILDMLLPKMTGLQVLRKTRQRKPRLPVLVLTCRDTVEDVVAALDAGADDYLAKPFVFAELTARLRALLRRGDRCVTTYRIADLTLDTAQHRVTRSGRKIELSTKEFALLEFLLRHAGCTVTRTNIIEHVWDIHFDNVSNVVDVYIKYLRDKIDKDFSPSLIRTVRGVGYRLTDDNDAVA
jgi:DNA-binding response OmpR family regulator